MAPGEPALIATVLNEPRPSARSFARRFRRELSFAAVGLGVMAVGFATLLILVRRFGVNPHLAYLIQAVLSVELSFVLSRYWTWGDRRGSSVREGTGEWLRFHASRCISMPANQAMFSLLIFAGAGLVAANAVCLAITSVFNYFVSHRLVFTHGDGDARR
jgi:putative flippase GtrA